MNLSLRCVIALAAFSAVTCAHADEPRKNVLTTINTAIEVQVKSAVLPLSSTSPLVVTTPCTGCAPKSYPQTATTQFFINKKPTTLQDLRAAVADKPDLVLTAIYSVKTGNLVSIKALLPGYATQPTRRR